MLRVRVLMMMVCCCVFAGAAVEVSPKGEVLAQKELRLELHEARAASSDLEVRGLDRGLRNGGPRFATRTSLEALPQVNAFIERDENFTEMPKGGVAVRGVSLEVLSRTLGVPAAVVAEAVAIDGYTTTYPAEYTRQHHPILVLAIDGMTPEAWAAQTHTGGLGPYFIAYDRFKPAFHVLSHEDRPQVPVQVVRLVFATEQRMFAGIRPSDAASLQVQQGYRIAQQNCFRCHNATGYGGTKSGRSWDLLAKDARQRPEWFANWVHDPQSIDAKAEMPANPRYDRATLAALSRYFSTIR